MPTYALLGATGSTGSAILRCLLAEPPKDLSLKILIRSQEKLSQMFGDLKSAPFPIKIIEGQANDPDAVRQCIEDANIIFNCIGTNNVAPGQSIVQDSGKSIIEALKNWRKKHSAAYQTPVVLLLRTTGLNDVLSSNKSWVSVNIGRWALHDSYSDLQKAHDLFADAATETPGLLQNITVDPPTIHDPDGKERTGYKLSVDEPPTASLNYADLGAAFCEIAKRKDEFVGQAVGVSATGKVNENWLEVLGYALTAMKRRVVG